MLSGGEKRRLQLVRVLIQNPNLLIFDEPTNDLDLYTLEILEDYLLKFKGPVLTVSHDRYFLDKICNKLFVFDNGKITISNLSFSEYIEANSDKTKVEEKKNADSRHQFKLPASIRNELNKLNEEMPIIEGKIKKLKDDLSKETTDYHKMMDLQAEIDKLNLELDSKMERYFELEDIKESYTLR